MKTQAKTTIKKAGAGTPATNNKQRKRSYLKAVPLSSLIQIGETLLLLLAGNEQPAGWQRFEQLLSQFYEGGVL